MPVNASGTGVHRSRSSARLCHRAAVVCLLLTVAACTDPFSAEMAFEKRIVAYGILSSPATQLPIRVSTTYGSDARSAQGPGPDTRVTDAIVIVADVSPGTAQIDTCLFSEALGTYLWRPASIVRGHRYRLTVAAEGLPPVEAVTIVPPEAVVTPASVSALREPSAYVTDLTFLTRLPAEAKGSLVQLMVDYEFSDAGVWVPGRIEVPLRLSVSAANATLRPIFPELTRRQPVAGAADWAYQYTAFEHTAYTWALGQIRSRYSVQGLKFRRAVVRVTQLDEHLYNYYNIANGFRDPYTKRVDEPDYTNVAGGYGIFGAAVMDSVLIVLPETIR